MAHKFLWTVLFATLLLFTACQKAPELAMTSPSSIELDVNGSSASISFTANRDWTASSFDSWVTVSPTTGKASDSPITVTVRCDANTTYDDRTATVTIRMEDLSQAITVRQPANKSVILPTRLYNLQSDSNTIELEVRANVQYTVSTSVDWIKQINTKGLSSRMLTFSIEENKTYDSREGNITIKPQEGDVPEQIIVVRQAQKDAILIKDTRFEVPYGGGEIEFKVEANVSFDVNSTVDWLHYVGTKALSDSNVKLSIDENNSYSAREGKVEISQQNGSIKHTITVSQAGRIAVTSIELDQTNLFIEPGKTATLTATVKPDNATDKTVTWSSSDTHVLTVDDAGRIWAIEEGTATITAKAGEKTAKCKVTVSIPVSSIELDRTELVMKPGWVEVLTATVMPDNASDKTVTWTTSNADVATVTNYGLVKMVQEGSAIITAKAGDKTAECKVTPYISVTSIELDKTELSLMLGETTTLSAAVKPDNATNKTVTWSSFDPTIATVDDTGKVTMVKEGNTTIDACAEDVHAQCNVTICIPVTSIELNNTELTLDPDEIYVLSATVMPDNATDKTVSWSSSDPAVATVDDWGQVKALKEGTATITAKAGDKTITCSVTVVYIVPDGAVDLGLMIRRGDGSVSRLFWAECNIGASKPEEFGDYYAWGEIETKERYSKQTYKWWDNKNDKPSKYYFPDILSPEDDVACVKLGGKWRIPTQQEWMELLNTRNNTEDYIWIWCDGSTEKYEGTDVEGWKIVRNATSATLFLPAAGFRIDARKYNKYLSLWGCYWSSSSFDSRASSLEFDSNVVRVYPHSRHWGFSVRPVSE